MTPFDKQKMKVAGIACVAVCTLVTIAGHIPAVSQFLTATPASSRSTNAAIAREANKQIASSSESNGLVNINTAQEDQLTTLKGIGSSKAAAIIAYRNTHGLFYRPEDLTKVPGIGEKMLEGIKEHISVGEVGAPPPEARAAQKKTTQTAAAVTAAPAITPSLATVANGAHIIITQVMTGRAGAPTNEFIELYNAGTQAIDLSGWSIKKKTASGAVSTLVSAARLKGQLIPAGKHFLIAGSGYQGGSNPDVIWPASYSLSHEHNGIGLYDSAGQEADAVSWNTIPPGQSCGRPKGAPAACALQEPQPHNSSH